MKRHTPKIVTLLVAITFGCLLTAGQALALPICELDCHSSSPCTQVCWVLGGGNQTRTCAMYICDEPQFPWPVATFDEVLAELDVSTPEIDDDREDAEAEDATDEDTEPVVTD